MKNFIIQFTVMVSVGILIGWFTNYLAIKLLFRPYGEMNFFLFKIQGLIPKRRDEIAENISEVIEKELISIDDIAERFKDSEFSEEIMDSVLNIVIGEKLQSGILEKNPFLKMFINDSMIEKIKGYIKEAILENREKIIAELIRTAKAKVNLREIMLEKMKNFSLEEVEEVILKISRKELKHIEIIGGILGGIISMFQFFLMILSKQI